MEKTRRSRSRSIALAAMLAALYAADVVFFAPISFQTIQVRVADALLPLSVLFGLPAVIGLTLGVLVGNLFASPFGAIDVVGGTIANFVATLLALLIGERKFRGAWVAATSVEILVITFIVGTYLAFLTETPLLFSLLYVMVGEVLSVGVGGLPASECGEQGAQKEFSIAAEAGVRRPPPRLPSSLPGTGRR